MKAAINNQFATGISQLPILSFVIYLLVLASAAGCASVLQYNMNKELQQQPTPSLGNVEYHTAILADELFGYFHQHRQLGKYRFAVAGFVPVVAMQYDDGGRHPLKLLGHQLEQGLMTEAARRGLITQDYKVTDHIAISDTADKVMTRDTAQLSRTLPDLDFFISGTLVEQQQGVMVNARVVHVESKDVVAAATKFFPSNVFWSEEAVTTRDGMLYRYSTDEVVTAVENEGEEQ